jgi:hypothetical protein
MFGSRDRCKVGGGGFLLCMLVWDASLRSGRFRSDMDEALVVRRCGCRWGAVVGILAMSAAVAYVFVRGIGVKLRSCRYMGSRERVFILVARLRGLSYERALIVDLAVWLVAANLNWCARRFYGR